MYFIYNTLQYTFKFWYLIYRETWKDLCNQIPKIWEYTLWHSWINLFAEYPTIIWAFPLQSVALYSIIHLLVTLKSYICLTVQMVLNFKCQEMKKLGLFMRKLSKFENIVRKQSTELYNLTFKRMWMKTREVARGS